MKDLLDKMKDAKAAPMPEHKMQAKMEVIKALKNLAQTLMMDDMGHKLMGKPDSVEIQMVSAKPEMMSHDEAMDADMDKFPQKEDTLLHEAMADDDSECMDDSEDMDQSDEEKLRAMLAKSKEESK